LAARFVRDEEAAGSNPATPTEKFQISVPYCAASRWLAQVVSQFGSIWEPILQRPGLRSFSMPDETATP
jgi:hypothetical protein